MTSQEYCVRTTTAATQGVAAVMALVAVMAVGAMGFAMGLAKAERAPLAVHAQNTAMPGVPAARVSLVTDSDDEINLAAVEASAPAANAHPVSALSARVVHAEPAAKPIEAIAAPQVEAAPAPATAPEAV